jgi:predicted site-specific integrase-resolvase
MWHSQMKQHLHVVPGDPTLRCWQRAGLIRVDKLPCKRRRLVIEDKGLRLLRLKMKAN